MNTRRALLLGLGKAAATVAAAPLALTVLEACTPTSVPMAPVQGGNPVGPDGRVAIDISDLKIDSLTRLTQTTSTLNTQLTERASQYEL